MPKRSRKVQNKVSIRDENQSAHDALQRVLESTGETEGKNPAAVALGRLGGLKGGRARADKLTPVQRRKSAMKAAKARWSSREKTTAKTKGRVAPEKAE